MKRLSNRLKESNSEKKKKSKSLQEAYPMIGYDTEDAQWRSLTDRVDRDLAPLVQDRMQDIACYLYDSNPMAHRIIEISKDFTVGEGFSFKAKEENVQQILNDFWNDPINNWDLKQYNKSKELSLFGEQLYPVFVNKHNGHVRLGYVDPTMINKVLLDPKNPEIFRKIVLKSNRRGKINSFNIINVDERITSPTKDMLVGDAFFFTINRVSSSTRGRSDLLPLADWIDGLDQFLFARLERAQILNAFIWDILLEGADEKKIKEFLQATGLPKPGSIRAHNEKVTWNAVTPKLEGSDASNEAKLFKMQILGGAGYPDFWFSDGSNTTRATALSMGLPTLKKLQSRQNYFKYMISHMFNFVIDQAKIHGTIPKEIDPSFVIYAAPLTEKNEVTIGVAAEKLSSSLARAEEQGWITKEAAAKTYKIFMRNSVGIDTELLEKKEKSNEIN